MREAAFRSITGTDRNENRKNSARRLTGSGWVQAARAERKYESAGLARDKCGLLEHNGYQHTENSLNLMNGCNPADLSARLDFARQGDTGSLEIGDNSTGVTYYLVDGVDNHRLIKLRKPVD
ncbi:hypothetical protein K0M31_017450 [Melipona bicolor]|uniref:Uncharacterized protein n=1 Tax=Melipona bicolor TaxID=60889 RepID=A0AA40KSF9_9HYME|nr:hypothetical protein K0M31_017450 [Melipona bicolor]